MALFSKKPERTPEQIARAVTLHRACALAKQRVARDAGQPEYIQLLAIMHDQFDGIHPNAPDINTYWQTFPDKHWAQIIHTVDAYLASDTSWQQDIAPRAGDLTKSVRTAWDQTLMRSQHAFTPKSSLEEETLKAVHPVAPSAGMYEDGWIMLASGAWRKIASAAFVLPASILRCRALAHSDVTFPKDLPLFEDLTIFERLTVDLMAKILQGKDDPANLMPFDFEETSELGGAIVHESVLFQKYCAAGLRLLRPQEVPLGSEPVNALSDTFDMFHASYNFAQLMLTVFQGKGPPDTPRAI